MLSSPSTSRRLAALAIACLLGMALPATPALAQKTKTKPAPAAEASTAEPVNSMSVDIPTIDAVAANMDEATLRDVFSGDLVDNAEALAGLTATSITIPEITLNVEVTTDDTTTQSTVVWHDIVLDDVVDGVAASVTMSGTTVTTSADASGDFGALSARQVDIGGLLGLYGLVDGEGQTEMQTLYSDFSFSGGSFTAPEISCDFGAVTAAEFRGRPISSSFVEIMALLEALDDPMDDPSPELLGKALHLYADVLTAFESSPVQFDGFDCSGVDEDDNAVDFSVASMTMGGMSPGIYPSIDMTDMDLAVGEDGTISIHTLSFKSIDLSAPLAAIQAAPVALDDSWFADNARSLIPAFAGFSIGDVAIDVPDPDLADGRIVASVGSFDLALSDYVNGIPTSLNTSANNVILEIPATSSDEQLQTLVALGLTSIDAGFVIDASWDETASTIAINEVSLTGADLATVTLAGTINNATEALFSSDETTMLAASMGLALSDLQLDIDDAGLSDIILSIAAAEQGSDAATLRPVFAGLAEGTVIGMLAGAAEAQKIGSAVSAFVSGKAKSLSIGLTAKQQPGLGIIDFMAAEQDPTVLLDKVTIDATN
ncbi:hypothetical protein [Devosia beringensis]|uniref:hypothetical protein n=1 Tax=Devosia beringensis TaxID=2657486 RepID=UPI00186B981E|nr:hypothetical protein [Devosia beringensis]